MQEDNAVYRYNVGFWKEAKQNGKWPEGQCEKAVDA